MAESDAKTRRGTARRKRSRSGSSAERPSRKADSGSAERKRTSRKSGSGSAERKRGAKASGTRKGRRKSEDAPAKTGETRKAGAGSSAKTSAKTSPDKPARPRRAARAPEAGSSPRLPWAIAGGLAILCMILLGMLLGRGTATRPEPDTPVAGRDQDPDKPRDKDQARDQDGAPDLGDEPISLADLRKGGAPGFSATADMKRRDAPEDTPSGYDAEQAGDKPEAEEPAPPTPSPSGDREQVKVTHVIDGDTAVLADGRKVRFIGINTPERNTPLYQEAKDFTRKLIGGREITIAFDKERKDRFGRTLAYLYVGETFVNAELVKAGLAYFYEFKPNTRHSTLFRKLQQEARKRGEHLWKAPVKVEDYYVGARRSHRFHRPSCKRASRRDRKTRWTHRDEALDAGLNPCGDCLP